ncbi:MAG TPA: hypothetical protein VFC07_12640, partial [Verrucomicrobiae bacterium]|nr:hypothetical protein [Verrucomicrobiae bacterium]
MKCELRVADEDEEQRSRRDAHKREGKKNGFAASGAGTGTELDADDGQEVRRGRFWSTERPVKPLIPGYSRLFPRIGMFFLGARVVGRQILLNRVSENQGYSNQIKVNQGKS